MALTRSSFPPVVCLSFFVLFISDGFAGLRRIGTSI